MNLKERKKQGDRTCDTRYSYTKCSTLCTSFLYIMFVYSLRIYFLHIFFHFLLKYAWSAKIKCFLKFCKMWWKRFNVRSVIFWRFSGLTWCKITYQVYISRKVTDKGVISRIENKNISLLKNLLFHLDNKLRKQRTNYMSMSTWPNSYIFWSHSVGIRF